MSATRYTSFDKFMLEVVEAVHKQHDLAILFGFDSPEMVVAVTLQLLQAGWWLFLGVVALLVLSPLAFGAALATFVMTPIGLAVVAILGTATLPLIRTLYQHKILPLAIKEIGEQYKPIYAKVLEKYNSTDCQGLKIVEIDQLFGEAVNTLIRKSKTSF